MADEKFLVTGAMGCLGAWVVRNLVQETVETAVFDLSSNKQRLELIMSASEIFKIIRQNKEKLSQLGVRQIGLFGSQSRGDATPDSDLDFLVEFIKGRKNYDKYIELCFFLEDLFSKKIDLLTPESLSPHLKEQILREVQYETIH